MEIKELNTEYGALQYSVTEGKVMVVGYHGRDIALTVPVDIDGAPVTIIGKKAFLGARELKELVLPEYVNIIQDWAFASCRSLEIITLPGREIEIGQGIFKDCVKLSRIITTEGMRTEPDAVKLDKTGADEAVSYLFAAAMSKLDAFYLFSPEAAGSEGWLEQWDARMLSLMEREDTDGFSKMLLCGEEDYGSRDNDLDYYIEQQRRFKVRLAMLRLMNDIGLKSDMRELLIAYLQSHKKGEESEETWKVVLEEYGDERKYYQFLLDNDCITRENIDAVLEDMGERHTEMKAFLINYKNTDFKKEDAFGFLEFDL